MDPDIMHHIYNSLFLTDCKQESVVTADNDFSLNEFTI